MSIFNSYVSLPEGNFWERLQRFLGDVPGELASQWFETGCLPLKKEKHQKVSQPWLSWLSWLPKWTTSPGTQHELLHSSPGTTQNPYSIGNQHETCLTYLGMKIWQVKNLKPPSSNRSHVKNVARRVLVVVRSTSSFLVVWMGFHISPQFPTYNWSGSPPSLSVPPDISHPNNLEVGLGLKIHIHTCTCIPISCHTMPSHTTASPYVTVYGMLHRIHTLHFISLGHIKLQYYIHYMSTIYIHTSFYTVYTLYGHCGVHIPWYSN